MSQPILTVMDLERVDMHLPESDITNKKFIISDNGSGIADYGRSVILNPNKDETINIINEIYANDGKCNKDLQCPCDTFMKYGHCGRGLFKNIRGGN